ncbi:MAG: hypothetical protein ACRDRU_07640 [Pseudonocardiaceae bacterium]
MDTRATGEVPSQYAGALHYAVLGDDKAGIRVSFPGRKVAGMVVTELSDDFLSPSFGDDSG